MLCPVVLMSRIGKFFLVEAVVTHAVRWGPLIGPGKTFDISKFFIFCGNALGSPYGSASPVTINPETGETYGPEFPLTTIRDDVK
jgi:homoserine acetyltransferase